MDILIELDAVIEEIRRAKPVPFSASAMISRKDLLERLEAIRRDIPEELRQARGLVQERDDVLGRVQREAETLLTDARAERDRLVARTEIVQAAGREADKIIEEAKTRAREIRMEAEDYVDAKLAKFEVVLQKTLAAVVKGRESLRGRLEPAPQPEEVLDTDEAVVAPGPPTPVPGPVSEGGRMRARRR